MSEGSSSKKRSSSDIVDCERASRAVWLVKVPRYLSETWEKNAGSDVGRLVQEGEDVVKLISTTPDEFVEAPKPSKPVTETKPATLKANLRKVPALNDLKPVANNKLKDVALPKVHSFRFRDSQAQTLGIFLEDKTGLKEDATIKSGKVSVEGRVVTRAECQPPNSDQYMRMKMNRICEFQPTSMVQKVDRAVVSFKPKSHHAESMMKSKAKKDAGIRSVRADREVVMDMIFQAFEKHQYYQLKDLTAITQQPASYVREILNDIANYITVPPHKNTWELKPEYRNYQPSSEAGSSTIA